MINHRLPLRYDSVNENNIRKQWVEDEWYYSVIDVIGELMGSNPKQAQNYYHVLKNRLYRQDVASFKIIPLKAIASDGKLRKTDFINIEGVNFISNYLYVSLYKLNMRLNIKKDDEVFYFHPKAIEFFVSKGWEVEHHVGLESGGVIDIVARSNMETLVVECKPKLIKSHLYTAIGQVLCYSTEYSPLSKPAIITQELQDDYALNCCKALGIQLFTLSDK
jgi:hypothetical protein